MRSNGIRAMQSLALLAALCAVPAMSAENWLTVQGDPSVPTIDTVQVQPESVTVFDDLRTMKIRVNRSATRQAYDGEPYRSYEATAEVDCEQRLARYRRHLYFVEPLWTGTGRVYGHPEGQRPLVAFRSMAPNPAQRLVQAACSLHAVKSSG